MKNGMKAVLIFAAMFLAAAAMPGQSFAQGAKDWGQEKEGKFDEMVKELKLTPQQQARIQQQRGQTRELSGTMREQMKAQREELRRELEKDKPDLQKIDQIKAQMKASMGQGLDQRIAGILAMKEILTPEQFRLMNERMEKKMQERGKGAPGDGKGAGRAWK